MKYVMAFAGALVATSCSVKSHYRVEEPAKLSQLWTEPTDLEQRDLFYGVGGRENMPKPTDKFDVKSVKMTGTQPGYDVIDPKGQEWSVKQGPEARVEVTLSRIVWALGYHQPVLYYVPRWIRHQDGADTLDHPGRFRLEPKSTEEIAEWPWHDNPFVGTRPLGGLWVLMVMFNNWDVKPQQNSVFRVENGNGEPSIMYVARDLGASLGKTSWIKFATKDDPDGFESEPFIERVENNRVVFHYKGSWLEPQAHNIATPEDVRWICRLMSRLTDKQWNDAFRAGGFTPEETARYVSRIKEKIKEGLALEWY